MRFLPIFLTNFQKSLFELQKAFLLKLKKLESCGGEKSAIFLKRILLEILVTNRLVYTTFIV